jgi:hypothetical protein
MCAHLKADWGRGYGRKGAALHGLKRYAITAPHCYCNPYGELSGGAGTTTRSRPTSAGSGCLTTRAAPSRFSQ